MIGFWSGRVDVRPRRRVGESDQRSFCNLGKGEEEQQSPQECLMLRNQIPYLWRAN